MAGMTDITRRDFLNGVALTIASGLSPMAQVTAQPARYPPAVMGMRGHHAGSFEVNRSPGELLLCGSGPTLHDAGRLSENRDDVSQRGRRPSPSAAEHQRSE